MNYTSRKFVYIVVEGIEYIYHSFYNTISDFEKDKDYKLPKFIFKNQSIVRINDKQYANGWGYLVMVKELFDLDFNSNDFYAIGGYFGVIKLSLDYIKRDLRQDKIDEIFN